MTAALAGSRFTFDVFQHMIEAWNYLFFFTVFLHKGAKKKRRSRIGSLKPGGVKHALMFLHPHKVKLHSDSVTVVILHRTDEWMNYSPSFHWGTSLSSLVLFLFYLHLSQQYPTPPTGSTVSWRSFLFMTVSFFSCANCQRPRKNGNATLLLHAA